MLPYYRKKRRLRHFGRKRRFPERKRSEKRSADRDTVPAHRHIAAPDGLAILEIDDAAALAAHGIFRPVYRFFKAGARASAPLRKAPPQWDLLLELTFPLSL